MADQAPQQRMARERLGAMFAGQLFGEGRRAPLLDGLAKIAASAISCAGEVYLIGGYAVTGKEEVTEARFFRYDRKLT